jgi:hypothetical protein
MAQVSTTRLNLAARYLPWFAGVVLIAGVVAFLVVKLSGNGSTSVSATPSPPVSHAKPATHATKPKAAQGTITTKTHNRAEQKAAALKFDNKARAVAGKFILTAVRRKHLAEAWALAGPAIRQDSTYREWLTGNIAVIPFLDPIAGATFSVQSLSAKQVSIGVAIIPKKRTAKVMFFDMRLIKVGQGASRHWVVNYWVPRSGAAFPNYGGSAG